MSHGSMPRKSRELESFSLYLRRGLVFPETDAECKFNPYHDPDDGRFTFKPGGGTLPPRAQRANMGHGAGLGRNTPAAKPKPTPSTDEPRRRVRELLRQRPRPSGLSEDVVAAAQAGESAHGVPAAITLAQFGLESAWGRRMPLDSNNPFGIKAKPGEPFVVQATLEQDRNGRAYRIEAKFRKYKSLAEAFEAHARLLQRPAYANAQSAQTIEDYADALTGGYATDRQYGSKLKSLIRQHGLNDFNLPKTGKTPQRP